MRNYRDLTQDEIKEMGELFPYTSDRELSVKFDVSISNIRTKLCKMYGWKKAYNTCQLGSKTVLTDEQIQWIVEHYSHTTNEEIMAKFDIGQSALRRVKEKYGLKKSKEHIDAVYAKKFAMNREICRKYGIYDEFAKRAAKQWEERKASGQPITIGFQKGTNNAQRLGKEKYEQALAKMAASRKELYRKERMRVKWGLEQKTKLNVACGGRRRSYRRQYFRQHGYIVEHSSNYVYYTEDTRRMLKAESTAHEVGLKILPYSEAI